jgi:hypothetical protein
LSTASAYAVVASLVELSAALCVVAVVPFGKAGVPLRFAAVPEVFWFSVGKSPATAIEGAPVVVVFFRMPVARPARDTPLIFPTVVETVLTVLVTSPVSAGIRAVGRVPLLMFVATVVSVVAEAANETLFVFVQVIAPVDAIVQSCDNETTPNAVPPAFPTCSCPALGTVLGTIAAFVCASFVTDPRLTSEAVTVTFAERA